MEPVIIKSTKGGRTLAFGNRNGDYFDAEVSGDAVLAKKKIWGYTDTQFLIDLFDSIARDWKGWEGERRWASIERDLVIAASCDRLGHVRVDIVVRNNDPDDDWQVDVPIFLDAGGLDGLASRVRAFFTQ